MKKKKKTVQKFVGLKLWQVIRQRQQLLHFLLENRSFFIQKHLQHRDVSTGYHHIFTTWTRITS